MKKGLGVCALLGALVSILPLAMAEPEPRVSPFSGKPVPRFESLRYSTVNGRVGPSLQYPIAWRYERSGLPVLIVKESMEWRRVRDPEGVEVWMHKSMLSGQTTGIIRKDAMLKRRPEVQAEDLAILQTGVIVDIIEVHDDMVKVRKDRLLGWIKQSDIWGDPPLSGS